jgi:hypothetical protein
MLGIIAELDDVEMAIVALDQVGLRSTAHFSDKTPGKDGHRSKDECFILASPLADARAYFVRVGTIQE